MVYISSLLPKLISETISIDIIKLIENNCCFSKKFEMMIV